MQYIVVLLLSALLTNGFCRAIMNLSIDYLVNRSQRKKIKKGQSFLEWLRYSRFRGVLPKPMQYWYYIVNIAYITAIATETILLLCNVQESVLRTFLVVVNACLLLPSALSLLYCVDSKSPSGFKMSRIIKQKNRHSCKERKEK